MVKAKISARQKTFSKKQTASLREELFEEHNPLETLIDKDIIMGAIAECLAQKDFEGIVEIITIHLKAVKFAKLQKAEEQKKTRSLVSYKDSFARGSMHIASTDRSSKKVS